MRCLVSLLALAILFFAPCHAAGESEIAVVVRVRGLVSVSYAGDAERLFASKGYLVMPRARIECGRGGYAQVRFIGSGSDAEIYPGSAVTFFVTKDNNTLNEIIDIEYGQLYCTVRSRLESTFDISTPAAIITLDKGSCLCVHSDLHQQTALFTFSTSGKIAAAGYADWLKVEPNSAVFAAESNPAIQMAKLTAGQGNRLKKQAGRMDGISVVHDLILKSSEGGTVSPRGKLVCLDGAEIDVSARADDGYTFTGWKTLGGNVRVGNIVHESTTVRLASDAVLEARFVKEPALLSITSTGNGKILPDGTVAVEKGQPLRVVAFPDSGFMCGSWKKSRGVEIVRESNDVVRVKTSARTGTVSAVFSEKKAIVEPVAGRGGTVKPARPLTLKMREQGRIAAEPSPGFKFIQWVVKEGNAAIENQYAAVTGIRCDSGDAAVEAQFHEADQVVTVTIQGHERATVRPQGVLNAVYGTILDVTVTPQQGYRVDGWSVEAGAAKVRGAEQARIRCTADFTIRPVIVTRTYDVTIECGEMGMVEPVGRVKVFHGKPFPVLARPDKEKHFVRWNVLGGSANFDNEQAAQTEIICMNNDAVIEAEFAPAVCSLSIAATAGGYTEPGGALKAAQGGVLPVRAVPNPKAAFIAWEIVEGENNIELSDTITEPEQEIFCVAGGNAAIKAVFSTETVEMVVLNNGLGNTAPERKVYIVKDRWTSIEARPNPGQVFVQWAAVSRPDIMFRDKFSPLTEVNPGVEDGTIKALFAAESGRIPAPRNDGGVTGGAPLTLRFEYDKGYGVIDKEDVLALAAGVPVTVTATPNSEYYFREWVVDDGVALIADRFNASTSITLTQGDATVRADFAMRSIQTLQAGFVDHEGKSKTIFVRFR